MNIFFTDKDAAIAAENLCDQHVIKMILESAQLLSTTHRVLDGQEYTSIRDGRRHKKWKLVNAIHDAKLYQATHINHPATIWVRMNQGNYYWLYSHLIQLLKEYEWRFKKVHKTNDLCPILGNLYPKNMPRSPMMPTLPPLCMPDKYKVESVTESYRNYMRGEKWRFGTKRISYARWTRREIPSWYWVNNSEYRFKTNSNGSVDIGVESLMPKT